MSYALNATGTFKRFLLVLFFKGEKKYFPPMFLPVFVVKLLTFHQRCILFYIFRYELLQQTFDKIFNYSHIFITNLVDIFPSSDQQLTIDTRLQKCITLHNINPSK